MKIAVVEDNEEYAKTLGEYVQKYSSENNLDIAVVYFPNGERFLEEYKSDFDIIFMDIEMPMMDGIASSSKVREMDSECIIIFVSNFMKYAIKGYSVNALDFLTKPLDYNIFKNTMAKAVHRLNMKHHQSLTLQNGGETYRLDINEIVYIEVYKHRVIYHTTTAEYDVRGSLQESEKQLPPDQFIRCNSGTIVNLKYVTGIGKDSLIVLKRELSISRSKKKDVLNALTRYIG